MQFTDKHLRCADCGTEFIWTVGEQSFFAANALKNEPRRCRACKAKRVSRTRSLETPASGPQSGPQPTTEVLCSACGRPTTVPFRPAEGRPVFCRSCFQQRKFRGGSRFSP